MKRTIKQRQELCTDLLHAILESADDGDLSLLETVIDEFIYKSSSSELDDLEDLLAYHSGENE